MYDCFLVFIYTRKESEVGGNIGGLFTNEIGFVAFFVVILLLLGVRGRGLQAGGHGVGKVVWLLHCDAIFAQSLR